MAATGRRQFLRSALLGAPLLLQAQTPGPARSLVGDVAIALTAGNAAQAMEPFSKKLVDYEKLRDYFSGLTAAFTIVNEVDVEEEENRVSESTATLRWALTLTSLGDNYSKQRSAELHVRAVREKKNWRIIDFAPISLFDPARAESRA